MGSMLAHEIKNPLSGIRGAAQLLETSVSDEDRSLTRLICDETDRIVKLVDRFEDFADGRPIEREPVNIHAVLEHVKRLAGSGFARHIRFVETYDPSLPPVIGNRDQLIQVFLNLVKNAAEAIGPDALDGEIELTTAFRPGVRMSVPGSRERVSLPLEFCVRDNGPGVPERPHPQPLRPVRDDEGVRQWPRSCTGCEDSRRPRRRRRVRSLCRGERRSGSSCRCMCRETGAPPSNKGESMPNGTILVADDDAAIRTVLNQALARAGYEVRSTGTASALWRWVAAGEGDLVVTDVVMPDENAFDVLPRIKKLRPDLPDHRDERAEHVHDRHQGVGARRLRIPAQALRPEGADGHRRPGAVAAESRRPWPATSSRTTFRWSAVRRPCRRSTALSPG